MTQPPRSSRLQSNDVSDDPCTSAKEPIVRLVQPQLPTGGVSRTIRPKHEFHDLLLLAVPTLRRRALKLTSDEHRAQDLVQTTLLKAWANRDCFQPETNLRVWLFTIMRNAFFSDLRDLRHEVEDVDELCALALAGAPRRADAIALNELIATVGQLRNA